MNPVGHRGFCGGGGGGGRGGCRGGYFRVGDRTTGAVRLIIFCRSQVGCVGGGGGAVNGGQEDGHHEHSKYEKEPHFVSDSIAGTRGSVFGLIRFPLHL